MLADLLINSATFKQLTWANVKGVKTPSVATATVRSVKVQPMRANRQTLYKSERGVTLWTVYCAVDPSLRAGDEIVYGSRVFAVLAPARDQAGRGQVWAVDCAESR